jgi:4-alpha-glucanotransferase
VPELEPSLRDLAGAYGIATEYWDWQGRHVEVARETVVAVLAALDVDAATPSAAPAALAEQQRRPWTRMLPPLLALREHRTASVEMHVPHGDPAETWIELETGAHRGPLRQLENWNPPMEIDGGLVGEASFEIPGRSARWATTPCTPAPHERTADDSTDHHPRVAGTAGANGGASGPGGWQLSSTVSGPASPGGSGTSPTLEDLAVWSAGAHGADFVLVNPLHAAEPLAPMEPSPYLPTSRRFANPIYLRLERVPEYALLDDKQLGKINKLRVELKVGTGAGHRDRPRHVLGGQAQGAGDPLLRCRVRRGGRRPSRRTGPARARPDRLRHLGGLSEEHGRASLTGRSAAGPGLACRGSLRAQHADRVGFHCWLQWLLDEQLASAHRPAAGAGMALGVMHDLAVGVSPHGADAWRLQHSYASGITVGAPPDPYNQNGQDWNQPPWRPDRLAATAYAPFRQMVSTILRHAGGIRVDHVIGLFRLWWIPAGAGPTEGPTSATTTRR